MLRILLLTSLFTGIITTLGKSQENFTIAVGFSHKSANVENSLKRVQVELSLRNILPNGIALRVQPFWFKNVSTSFLSSLVSFCDVIATGNISVVIIVDDMGKSSWIIPWVSSMLGIPVSLAYESSISKKKGVSTVFSMVPSVSEVSKAVGEIVRHFGWRDFAILTDEGEESAEITRKLRESMPSSGDPRGTKVLFHRQFNPRDHKDVSNIVQTIASLDVTAIFLHCEPSGVESIFSAAKRNGLLTADRVWIVTEAVIAGCSTSASNCPPGLIGLWLRRLRYPAGEEKRPDLLQDLLRDNVMVYAEALRSLLRRERFTRLAQSSCKNKHMDGGDKLFRYALDTSIRGRTGLIKFDNKGNRVEPEYEIVSLKTGKNGTMEWVPVAFWVQGSLKFNDNRFEWPGVANVPSVGFARKRVLQVVTILSKPYSYHSDAREFGRNDKPVCAAGYLCKMYGHNNTNRSGMTPTFHCCKGLVIDLLKMLEIDVGFQSDLHVVRDGKYGFKDNKTGEWNGMIGEILRGEADLAIADLTITELRSGVVDFSHPFLPTGQTILVSVRKTGAHWFVRFLTPYSWNLWIAAVITVNIIIIVLWMLDRFSPLGHYRRSVTVKEKKTFNLVTSLWYTWGTIFHVDEAEARPKSFSARTLTVCFAFAMTILATSYTANLAAVLVSEYEDFPVDKNSGIRDLKFQEPPQNFKFGTVSDSLEEKLFKESSNPVYTTIWKNMRNVAKLSEGVEKVLSGELDAFISDEPSLLYQTLQQQQLRVIGPTVFKSGFGLALPKNSIWTHKLSNALITYQQLEIPKRLGNLWLRGKCSEQDPPTVSRFAVGMGLQDMRGVFTILSIGIGVALILLFVEFKVAKHGFPLSRIWTNGRLNGDRGGEFTPTQTTSSTDRLTAPQLVELNFSRQRTSVVRAPEERN